MKKIFIYSLIALFILTASYTVMIPPSAEASCNIFSWGIVDCVSQLASFIIVPILGAIVKFAAELLNYSITWTMDLANFITNVPAIELAWKTIRDFATMTFIFLILYHAISMILGLEGFGKKFIVNVVVAGLLINFSFFFTKVMIDASNVVTLQFYNGIAGPNNDLGGVFMAKLNMQRMLDKTVASNAAAGTGLTVLVMGSILMLVAAFTFFAAACLFLVRSATLILLMALSPFAYVGNVMPDTGQGAAGLAKKWWPLFLSQCTFAPIFLMLVYIGMKIMSDSKFFDSAVKNTGTTDQITAIIFNFVIVIMFFLFALIVAKESGTYGAGKVIGWGKSLQKWGQGVVGRNTVGRGARLIGKGYDAAEASLKSTSIGRSVANAANIATLGIAGSINRGVRAGVKVGETSKYGSGESLADKDKEIRERNKVLSTESRASARNSALKTATSALNNSSLSVADRRDALDKARKEVTKMSTKELEQLKLKDLTNPELAIHLSAGQMDAVMKSDEFNDGEKAQIRKAREDGLIAMLNNPTIGGTPADRIEVILENRKPEDIAKLPATILKDPMVSIQLEGNVLAKIARDGILSKADRTEIRQNFEGHALSVPVASRSAEFTKAYNWLTTGPGASLF